ncbi:MAG: LysM peptidoglycan-binding domain-containing protein [Actinomycetota bacterium]
MTMTPIEEQLRRYADAVDPTHADVATPQVAVLDDHRAADPPSRRRLTTGLSIWAAASVLVVVGVVIAWVDDSRDQQPIAAIVGREQLEAPDEAVEPATVKPVDTTSSGPVEERFAYIVEEGDLLSAIAVKFGVTPEQILAANSELDLTTLTVGQSLWIPHFTRSSDAVPWDEQPHIYFVTAGDTLTRIASAFNMTPDMLIRANPGIDPNVLMVGQELIIPGIPPLPTVVIPGGGAQPPLPGVVPTREEQLTVQLAELLLLQECAMTEGIEFGLPTDTELIQLHGSWQPSGILGIGRAGAARSIGYHDSGWGGGGSPTQTAALAALEASEREAFGQVVQNCWPRVHSRLRDDPVRRSELTNQLFGSDGTQGAQYRDDPGLARALVIWQECVAESGVVADTPNELARRFAFQPEITDEERSTALVDVACQELSGLEWAFYTARAEAILATDQADLLRELAHINLLRSLNAMGVREERGLVPPSLD